MSEIKPHRVRFAPSPTGHVHLGSARTALYDYLIAKQTGGSFILRIEDTDQKRLVPGAEKELRDGLQWLGIQWDEGPEIGGPYGPYRQSERKEIYQKYAEQLIDERKAYYCFCSPDRLKTMREQLQKQKKPPLYDGLCRNIPIEEAKQRVANGEPHVIRFKTPKKGTTVVHDLIRGDIRFKNETLDDSIILKTDGWALYHLAAMVDDHLMHVTHVIRGSEWLPTSPLHHLIWKAFGWDEPIWVHLSVFLKPSGKGKMSKREAVQLSNDGYSIFIKDLKDLGYLPEAVINWIALMGWSFDDHTEFFTLNDLVKKFSLEKLNPSPAAINFSKLDHFNKLHIKNKNDAQLAVLMQPFFEQAGIQAEVETLTEIAPVIKDRIITLDDAVDMCRFLFLDEITQRIEGLLIKGFDRSQSALIAKAAVGLCANVQDWTVDNLDSTFRAYMEQEELSPRQMFGYLREAISGQRVTPPIFDCMLVLGRVTTIKRLEQALEILKKD